MFEHSVVLQGETADRTHSPLRRLSPFSRLHVGKGLVPLCMLNVVGTCSLAMNSCAAFCLSRMSSQMLAMPLRFTLYPQLTTAAVFFWWQEGGLKIMSMERLASVGSKVLHV